MVTFTIDHNKSLPTHMAAFLEGKTLILEIQGVAKNEAKEFVKTNTGSKLTINFENKEKMVEIVKHIRWEMGQIAKALEAKAAEIEAEMNAPVVVEEVAVQEEAATVAVLSEDEQLAAMIAAE